jgi:hypothetical protein
MKQKVEYTMLTGSSNRWICATDRPIARLKAVRIF